MSKQFSPAQSYSPDAEKPLLSVLSCLFSGSDSLSLELPVALGASRKKHKEFGGKRTIVQPPADQNSGNRKIDMEKQPIILCSYPICLLFTENIPSCQQQIVLPQTYFTIATFKKNSWGWEDFALRIYLPSEARI